jgi:hypothetical protein
MTLKPDKLSGTFVQFETEATTRIDPADQASPLEPGPARCNLLCQWHRTADGQLICSWKSADCERPKCADPSCPREKQACDR